MPFKSLAQRRTFAQLLVEHKISPQTFEEWNRETGRRTWLLLIAGAALVIRLGWMMWPSWETSDSPEYLRIATNLLRTGMYSQDGLTPSSYRPPLYPALLALLGRLTGHSIAPVLLLQAVLGAATVLVTFRTAERCFGTVAAVGASLLLAVAPMTGRFAATVMTETLFTFLVVCGVSAWLRNKAVLAGVLFGAATLTRAALLPYLLLLVIASRLPLGAMRRQLGIISATALLIVTPWAVRNVVECGRVTIADAGWGTNLLYGTVDLHSGSNRWVQLTAATRVTATVPANDPSGYEQLNRRQAVARIRAHPIEWLRIRVRQYPWLFLDTGDYLPVAANRFTFRDAWRTGRWSTVVLKAGFVLGNLGLVLLALIGVFMHRARTIELAPLWSFPLFLALAHAPVYIEPRYGLPLMPFIMIFAASVLRRSAILPAPARPNETPS